MRLLLKGGPEHSKYRDILPGALSDLHEVFAEPEDSRLLSERRLWFPTSDYLQNLAHPLRNDPV